MPLDEMTSVELYNSNVERGWIDLFTTKQSWNMSETNIVMKMLRNLEVWRLGHCDGCMCCHFSIRDVNFDVSCGKGLDRGVKVSSQSGDYVDGTSRLKMFGEEVARQVMESDGRGPVSVITEEPK